MARHPALSIRVPVVPGKQVHRALLKDAGQKKEAIEGKGELCLLRELESGKEPALSLLHTAHSCKG